MVVDVWGYLVIMNWPKIEEARISVVTDGTLIITGYSRRDTHHHS